MRKQIDGQINLFDYISEEEKNIFYDKNQYETEVNSEIINDKNKQSIKKDKNKKENKHTEKNANVEKNQNSNMMISFYKECSSCWCSTCSHNKEGKAVPRDFAGEKKPCPSCDFCIRQKKAEICEIGSYENGCKLRAEEEGIFSD